MSSGGWKTSPEPNQPGVLVLGCYQQTITVVRSLARAGLAVFVGRCGPRSSVELSRFTHAVWPHPDPRRPVELRRAVASFLETRPDVRCVFPVGELELDALLPLRFDRGPEVVLAAPALESVRSCLDKTRTYELVAELGIPLPRTTLVRAARDMAAAAREIGFPLVLKRPSSFSLLHGEKAVICRTAAELASWDSVLAAQDSPILVQSWFPGDRHNCQFAARAGEIVAYFEQEVLRTDRPNGTGYGVEGISVAPRDDLRRFCAALLGRLRYSGVGCIQFLVRNDSPDVAFLECNPRLDATCDLPYRCGVDFPLLAIQCAEAARPPPIAPAPAPRRYPTGKRFYALFRDLQGLRAAREAGALCRRQLVGSLAAAGVSALRFDRFQLAWSWSDPLPTLHLAWEAMESVLRRARARTARALRNRCAW